MKIYLVGGAVRDELLGRDIHERDWVVVGATPDDMIKQGFIPVGKFFPVFLHPDTKEEYALARTERKVAGGYHGFSFDTSTHVTLEEDLKRRDLTINAMAKLPDGKIIDPYGGQQDLQNRILRHVSSAFSEDPVRVLRIARFLARYASLGFQIAEETLALMRKMVEEGEVDHLVQERVWKEMERALSEPSPQVFVQTLRRCGALKVLLPEVNALYGVPQNPEHHPEIDTGIHIEMVLTQAARLSPLPEVRFAALLHDLGKALTPKDMWPSHSGHEAKSAELVVKVCERLKVPNDFRELALLVAKYHGEAYDVCKALKENNPEPALDLFEKCDVFRRPERFEQFLLACEADFCGRPGYEHGEYPGKVLKQILDYMQTVQNFSSDFFKGLSGEEIKAKMRQTRLEKLIHFLKNKNPQ